MKLRKLLAVTAVAATMTAAFAVNAMADTTKNLNSGADFTYEGGYITLTEAGKAKLQADGPYTMLVVATDGKGLDANTGLDTSFEDTDIKQIDESSTAITKINVGTLAEGTYEIRLGGDGQVRWGTLEVKGAGKTVLVGDANGDGEIGAADAAQIALYAVDSPATTVKDGEDTFYAAAYCNGDAEVGAADAAQVALYAVDSPAANALINTKVEIGSIK